MKDLSAIDPNAEWEDFQILKKEIGDRRTRILTAATLILLPLVYFYPAVIGQIALVPGDGLTQNLGVRILIGQMLRAGQLPLWNPYIFAGTPLLASIYPGALYPPNWLFALFSPVTAMNIVVITTYHLTLIGTYLYGRRIGMTRIGALIAGVSFTFGGYMMAHMGHTSRIAAAVWLPWILLAFENLYHRLTWRWIALGAAFIALQLFAGEPQMNFYTILVCGAYLLFSFFLREERERRWRFVFGVAAMSVCGALLSAIQLLPERELLKMGERAAISYEYFSGYSFPPANILTFVFPFFFGGATIPGAKVPYWGMWTIDETCGYFGLLTLLLALVALFGARRRSLTFFWGVTALVALTLSFGSYLPFGWNHILHKTPVYSLFRASGRHMYEFTFSLAVIAGLGASYIARSGSPASTRALRRGSIVFAAVVAITAVVYRFFSDKLPVGATPRIALANSLTNFEAWVPVAVAALSLATVWIFARRRGGIGGALAVLVIFADLMFFGLEFNWAWRDFVTGVSARLQDPPAVQFIKSREADLNSFRIVSDSQGRFGYKYDELDFPNVSIARGLQSVNGYDALRLNRQGAISGDMGGDGLIPDSAVFNSAHQGFNLLNVKYALRISASNGDPGHHVEVEGVRFSEEPLNLSMTPGAKAEALLAGVSASELAIVSTMSHSIHIPDDTPVVQIRLHAKDGRVIEQELRAGRDTAEWAYERKEVRAVIKHRLPKVAESFPAEGFPANRYLARLPFDRADIERIEFNYLLPDASVLILRASLVDSATGTITPLSPVDFQGGRWRSLASFGSVEVYENTKALPRAWFVRRAAVAPRADVLETIKTGRMKDGSAFDPAETVLFEKEDFGDRKIVLPQIAEPTNAEVKIARYEPQRIEIATRNGQPGFLVLSETYYRGWEAWIDGRRAPVEQVDYLLRGVAVPAGEHHIEFIFRAHSFRNGAAWSLLGILLLFLGGGNRTRRMLSKTESRLEGTLARLLPMVGAKLKRSATRSLVAVESWLSAASKSKFVMVVAVIGLLVYGGVLVKCAAYAVGGSDSSGYTRIARSLLKGDIAPRVAELDLLALPNDFARVFIPLAYDPGARPGMMAPLYPVGLPLLLALGALIGGWEYGPFLVVPIVGTLGLLLFYLVGLELGLSRLFSVAGAVMLAASPTYLLLALQPMSDVVATLWALVVIWASLRSRKRDGWAILAGAAFGMAFLTRPTNIILMIPILFTLPLKPKTLFYFFLGGLPLAGVFFAYNMTAYGHPLRTGYGQAGLLGDMMLSGFTVRFAHYRMWLTRTLGPLLLLGWLGVAADRKVHWRDRGMLISWFGSFLLLYSFYNVYEAWWYTRFLLPGYPALVLGTLLVVRDIPGLLKNYLGEAHQTRLKWVALAILLGVTLSHERRYIRRFDLLSMGAGTSAHSASCRWANQTLPSQAVVVAMEMSGALKFYTERPILRWDCIYPPEWTVVKNHAAEKGYRWYALLLPLEIENAQKRLGGKWVKLGMLDQVSLWQIEPTAD
jgi:hypothetical protein